MANITVTLYWDMDLRKWTTTLNGTTETDPIQGLVQGDIVKFAVRFIQNDVAVVLAAPVFTASGIKADNDFTGSYLIQLSAPVLSDTTLYTFTVNPLNSANLNTFLQTYRNTWCALEIYDSANGILTTPLELQITPGYSLSGTPTDNAPGVIVVAATKTVTFPQSLTFPSALGTNGFQLTTDGAGALTWAASGALTDGDKGDITVSNSGATFTIDNDVVGLAQLAHMPTARVIGRTTAGNGSPELLTISGTGSVAMTNTPTLVTPVLGAATATTINGVEITGAGTLIIGGTVNTATSGGVIDTSTGGGSIYTSNGGGSINTSGIGGSISTSDGGGSITTNGTGSIGFGVSGTRTTLTGSATSNIDIALPNLGGTVVVTAATSATATQALFAQATGFPAYRAIATADIATALTTPGAIGGTTASTGAFTTISGTSTLTLGVVSATAGTIVLRNATNVYTTTIVPGVVAANRQLNLPVLTATDTVAVLGLAQTFTGVQTFNSDPVAPNQSATWGSIGSTALLAKSALNGIPAYSIPLAPTTNATSLADGNMRPISPFRLLYFNFTLIPAHYTRFRVTLYFGWTSNPSADLFPVYLTFMNPNQAGSTVTETLHGTRFGQVVYPDTSTGLPGTQTDLGATEPDSFKFVSDIITIPAGWQTNAAANGFYALYQAWIANNSGGALTDALGDNHPITGKIDFFL